MSVRCAHPLCHCEVSPERLAQEARHCADSCVTEEMEALPERTTCGCGHDACAMNRSDEHHGHQAVAALGAQYPGNK